MELNIIRNDNDNCWMVTGKNVDAQVFGTKKFGTNGAVTGKGAKNFRKEILKAVDDFRAKDPQ